MVKTDNLVLIQASPTMKINLVLQEAVVPMVMEGIVQKVLVEPQDLAETAEVTVVEAVEVQAIVYQEEAEPMVSL